MMERLENLEKSFQNEVITLQHNVKSFHLRVIKLESELRTSNSEIRRLTAELNEKRLNETKISKAVIKMGEVTEQLKEKYLEMEERIIRVETAAPPPPPPPPSEGIGSEVLDLFNEISSEIKSKFEEWNGKQVSLKEELYKVVQIVKNLERSRIDPLEPEHVLFDHDKIQVTSHTPIPVIDAEVPSPPLTSAATVDPDGPYSDDEEVQVIYPQPIPVIDLDLEFPPLPPPMITAKTGDCDVGSETTIQRLSSPSHSLSRGNLNTVNDDDPPIQKIENPHPRNGSSAKGITVKWKHQHGVDISDSSRRTCLCGFQSKSIRSLEEHIKYFTKEWKFSCRVCQKRFDKYTMLKLHMARIHNTLFKEGAAGCRKCGLIFSSRLRHTRHYRLCRGDDSELMANASLKDELPNEQVERLSHSFDRLARSILRANPNLEARSFSPDPPLPPDVDDLYTFQDEDEIIPETPNHSSAPPKVDNLNRQHGVDPSDPTRASCLCGTKLKHKHSLQKHIQYFTGSCKFCCSVCSRQFTRYSYLKRHLIRSHKINVSLSAIGCCKCGVVFRSREKYSQHLPLCNGVAQANQIVVAPQQTNISKRIPENRSPPKEFAEPSDLKKHIHGVDYGRQHLNFCLCKKRYKNNRGLMRHVRYYTLRKVSCKICRMWFADAYYLKGHILRKHKIQPGSNNNVQPSSPQKGYGTNRRMTSSRKFLSFKRVGSQWKIVQ